MMTLTAKFATAISIVVCVTMVRMSTAAQNNCSLVGSDVFIGNISTELVPLNKSQYCFVNECVIQIHGSNVLLSVVNNSKAYEDQVLIVGNSSMLFSVFPHGIKCLLEDNDANRQVNSFLIIAISYLFIVVLSAINIVLHLLIKELRNVMGVLIVWFCTATAVISLLVTLRAIYTYLHQVNEDTGICAAFNYLIPIFVYVRELARVMILFHFAYLMYRSHKVKGELFAANEKWLLYKYQITIIILTLFGCITLIPYDAAASKNGFDTDDGYCTGVPVLEGYYSIVLTSQLVLLLVTQNVIFSVGIVLYFKVKRSCCGKITKDFRVSIALIATTGIAVAIYNILFLARASSEVILAATNASTIIEQIVFLVMFSTTKKVTDYFKRVREKTKPAPLRIPLIRTHFNKYCM